MSEQAIGEKILWISVKEQPSDGDYVLLMDHEGNVGLGVYNKKFKQVFQFGRLTSQLGIVIKWTHVAFNKDDTLLTQCGVIIHRNQLYEEAPTFQEDGEEEGL